MSAMLRITQRLDFSEGSPMIEQWSTEWPDRTAKEAYRERLGWLRAAGADIVAVNGTTIIVRHQRERWTETETLTFTDVSSPPLRVDLGEHE